MNAAAHEEWKPSRSPWYSAGAVMLTIFMVVLDSSIANVALPNIAGSFSATQDESTWVLTSYLVANGVIIPSTAWFQRFLGRKISFCSQQSFYRLISLAGWRRAWGCCFARVIQGLGGGAIMPTGRRS